MGKKALEVHQALGDPTRYAIFTVVSGSTAAMTTMEIAKKLQLHPNTVRPHLDKLRSVGLLEVYTDRKGSVGRPANRYKSTPIDSADNSASEASALQMLVTLMVSVVESCCPLLSEELVVDTGRQWAVSDLESSSTRRKQGLLGVSGRLTFLLERMNDLGFSPQITRWSTSDPLSSGLATSDDTYSDTSSGRVAKELRLDAHREVTLDQQSTGSVEVVFKSCPYEAWSHLHPQLVCSLHRGMVEGYVQMPKGKVFTEFNRRGDPQPCRVAIRGV